MFGTYIQLRLSSWITQFNQLVKNHTRNPKQRKKITQRARNFLKKCARRVKIIFWDNIIRIICRGNIPDVRKMSWRKKEDVHIGCRRLIIFFSSFEAWKKRTYVCANLHEGVYTVFLKEWKQHFFAHVRCDIFVFVFFYCGWWERREKESDK